MNERLGCATKGRVTHLVALFERNFIRPCPQDWALVEMKQESLEEHKAGSVFASLELIQCGHGSME